MNPPEPPMNPSGLAQRQAALVQALVAGGPMPAGFDPDAVTAAARALLRKRADEVARRFPLLVHGCGGDFRTQFIAWAAERPKTSTAADAAAFAEYAGVDPSFTDSRPKLLDRLPFRH